MTLGVRVLAATAFSVLWIVAPVHVAQEPVDVEVHQPPAVVGILGVPHLVHELWIVNRLSSPVTLVEVSVAEGTRAIASFRGSELVKRIGRPRLPRNHPSPLVLEPNQPAVAYFWIALPSQETPLRVEHRVTVDVASTPTRRAVVDGGAARVSPPSANAVLDPPVSGDGWAAVYDPLLIGGHRTAIYDVDGRPRIPGRFAIDWIRLLPSGRAHADATSRPADWNGFGADVLAVKDADVAAAVDGRPDADASGKPRETITRENAAGNYIALDLGDGRFAFYEHLQQGSVRVKVGERVTRGMPIARIGSSGSVSSGPHLHFHVSDANSLLGAEGVPFVFREFAQRGAFASIQAFAGGEAPTPAPSGLDRRRRLERPGPNAAVDFGRQPGRLR